MTKTEIAHLMAKLCASLFDRGYSVGGAGNVSARLEEGGFLVTPTNSSLGRLDPDNLSLIDADGNHASGPRPSKEFAFHGGLYDCRPETGAIVHLHATHLTALSCLPDLPSDNAIRPFTPYYVMRAGYMPVIPYYKPGSPEIGQDLVAAANKHPAAKAFLLASHGVVVLGKDLEDAVNNAEELEETAKLLFLLRREEPRYLTDAEVEELR